MSHYYYASLVHSAADLDTATKSRDGHHAGKRTREEEEDDGYEEQCAGIHAHDDDDDVKPPSYKRAATAGGVADHVLGQPRECSSCTVPVRLHVDGGGTVLLMRPGIPADLLGWPAYPDHAAAAVAVEPMEVTVSRRVDSQAITCAAVTAVLRGELDAADDLVDANNLHVATVLALHCHPRHPEVAERVLAHHFAHLKAHRWTLEDISAPLLWSALCAAPSAEVVRVLLDLAMPPPSPKDQAFWHGVLPVLPGLERLFADAASMTVVTNCRCVAPRGLDFTPALPFRTRTCRWTNEVVNRAVHLMPSLEVILGMPHYDVDLGKCVAEGLGNIIISAADGRLVLSGQATMPVTATQRAVMAMAFHVASRTEHDQVTVSFPAAVEAASRRDIDCRVTVAAGQQWLLRVHELASRSDTWLQVPLRVELCSTNTASAEAVRSVAATVLLSCTSVPFSPFRVPAGWRMQSSAGPELLAALRRVQAEQPVLLMAGAESHAVLPLGDIQYANLRRYSAVVPIIPQPSAEGGGEQLMLLRYLSEMSPAQLHRGLWRVAFFGYPTHPFVLSAAEQGAPTATQLQLAALLHEAERTTAARQTDSDCHQPVVGGQVLAALVHHFAEAPWAPGQCPMNEKEPS